MQNSFLVGLMFLAGKLNINPKEQGIIAHFLTSREYNPLRSGYDLDGNSRGYELHEIGKCPCPCPKISAPIWAAGFIAFSPLL